MTTPVVELVPGDDFSLTLTITDANGDAIDYSGWSVHTAQITWDDASTSTLSVDLTDAATGIFVLTCADTETDGQSLGLKHSLTLKLQSSGGLERTVYYANVKGVETLTADTATGLVPGTQGPSGVGDKYDVAIFAQNRPLAGEVITRIVVSTGITFAAALSGSYAKAETASTGAAEFSVQKNDVEFGTITFTASATGTLAAASETTFSAGDILSIVAPAFRDATLADISITLAGDRSS